MPSLLRFLLPRSDGAVIAQLAISLLIAIAVVVHLRRAGRPDSAWFAAGIGSIWFAFMAFRALH